MEERLSKLLSRHGIASRREAEGWIQSGRVSVNGQPARLGQRVEEGRDQVCVDGKPIAPPPKRVCLMLHKPRGYVTTRSDEQGRRCVMDLIAGCGYHLYPVGRLDLNSEGLLLMTNDGDLAYHLTHPSHEVEKEYHVRVSGAVNRALGVLNRPMTIDGERLQPARVKVLRRGQDSTLLSVTIRQGKNRQVRRMCKAAGLTVHRLRRVREGALSLGSLPCGSWRWLTEEETELLRR